MEPYRSLTVPFPVGILIMNKRSAPTGVSAIREVMAGMGFACYDLKDEPDGRRPFQRLGDIPDTPVHHGHEELAGGI